MLRLQGENVRLPSPLCSCHDSSAYVTPRLISAWTEIASFATFVPLLDVIPIGSQGIAFDRLDLDSWADDYKSRNGHPAVCESTGTGDIGQAKEYLAKRVIELRETRLYGTRELRSFRSAATKYLQDYNHKKRIKDDALQLKQLDPFIGSLELKQVHMGSLQDFIAKRRQDGVKTKTLNMALAVVRRVLNLASSEWMDRQGKTWLGAAPKIKLFPVKDARSPYPLTREEQALLFQELPDHLARMALFKVNTGLREKEVCRLKWDYEVNVPELDTSVFIIPGEQIKNGEERLVVLNRVAKSVVEPPSLEIGTVAHEKAPNATFSLRCPRVVTNPRPKVHPVSMRV
jgi:site-specific recombinase XerC